jgi:hypothetical protein
MQYRLYVQDAISKEARPPLDIEAATDEAAREQATEMGMEVLQVEPTQRGAAKPPLTAQEVIRLQERVVELERRLGASNLHSDRFLARAFAVWGHFIVAHLIIALLIGVPLGCLSVLFSSR